MIIQRARAYGMCFGVRDAITQALDAARNGPVTVLGQLVHNPQVIAELHRNGVRIAELGSAEILEPDRRYLITAHGVSDSQRKAWQQTGASLSDTTCPLVRHAHESLKKFVARGLLPVVIGKPLHVEVLGLTGDFPDAIVLEKKEDISRLPQNRDLGIVAQTTQPIDSVIDLIEAIRAARPGTQVHFTDTVCRPTKERQRTLHDLCREVQVVIVVGGRYSNNTHQLCLAALSCGVTAYHVEKPEELQPEWFRGIERAGLTAGTSTPDSAIDAVEQEMIRLSTTQPAALT